MKIKKLLRHYALGIGLCCPSFILVPNALADSYMTTGRYLRVAVIPQKPQQNLLQQRIQIKFPNNVLTLGKAIRFLLQFSGYQLNHRELMGPLTRDRLNQPLPEIDRNFGPMTLQQALTTLIGNPFYVVLDPVHRLVSFKLKFTYQSLYVKPIVIGSSILRSRKNNIKEQ